MAARLIRSWRSIAACVLLTCITLVIYRRNLGSQQTAKDLTSMPSSIAMSPQQRVCTNMFGDGYVSSFADSFAQYCDQASQGSLTCFDHSVKKGRTDSFCFGGPVAFDTSNNQFDLNCDVLPAPKNQHGELVRSLSTFPIYWYSSGPSWIFRHFLNIAKAPSSHAALDALPKSNSLPTLVLIKREIANFNLWHNLMEVMSTMHSIEILARTQNHDHQDRFRVESQKPNTHMVLLDDEDEGPYLSLWGLVTPNPVLRLNNLTSIEALQTSNLIVPLPGAANPFWEGDWADINCGEPTLLQSFSRRVLSLYSIPPRPQGQRPLIVTVIDRKDKRRLLHQQPLLNALATTIPSSRATIQLIDFAAIPFPEQVRIAHATDILVGVHGAGLTHGMFLPPQSAIVEFMPFALDHRGFRNMAKFLGHDYRGAKTVDAQNVTGARGDWQGDDVVVEESDWLREVVAAVEVVEHARGR